MLLERQSSLRAAASAAPAIPPTADPSADAFDRLRALVANDMDAVNALIAERMISPVPLIPELASHLIASGGKRLRPMLTLATAALCGYAGDGHVKLATAVEFIHTATLLHDDVVDQSDLRRGSKTANVIWGNQSSILVGDFLFSRAFQLMVEAGSLQVLGVLSNASAVIAEGEVLQLQTARRIETTTGTYMQVISAKTAALFAAAAEVGALVAGRPAEEAAALADYGHRLGIAFQLIDDLLDYTAHQTELGKTVGDDFREGKVTLPLLLAVARGDAEDRAFWLRVIDRGLQEPGDLALAMGRMERAGAFAETLEWARREGAMAKLALARFPDGPHRQALIDIVDFCVARAY